MEFTHKSLKPTYYELLEINMGADEEEIRRAYDRSRQIYAEDALATYGLYTPEEIREWREQIERAFRALIDTESRRAYDRTLITEPIGKSKRILVRSKGEAQAQDPGADKPALRRSASTPASVETKVHVSSEPEEAAPKTGVLAEPAVKENGPAADNTAQTADPNSTSSSRLAIPPSRKLELPEGAAITGANLRALRESAGIDLRDIAAETKVSIGNLRLLEDEDWSKLPAWVYVRGFVVLYARHLGLDGKALLSAFKSRHAAAHHED